MADHAPPIARIRLARSALRLLTVPIVVGVAGTTAMAAGILVAGGAAGIALAVLGGLLVAGAIVGGLVLLSVHVDVEEAAVVIGRMGGARRYTLTPGPVTRVRVRGPSAARLQPRFGAMGWGLGPARLRGEENIELVRLARTNTLILIPTERGRLALAPARDEELLDALSRAARARQRLDPAASAMPTAEPEATPVVEPAPPVPVEPEPELRPVAMTGIERALLEERLAREHMDDERAAEEIAAAVATATAAAEMETDAVPVAEIVVHPTVEAREAAPRGAVRRWVAAASFVLLPTAGAAIALALGVTMGEIPEPGSDVARITVLGLVLAGPATSVGAIMALAWWPRIVGIVVAGGLAATVFIGRSLVGG